MSGLQATSLGDTFRRTAAKFPDKVGYRLPGKGGFSDVTYSEAWDRVFDRARDLWAAGVRRGDRLLIIGETGFEWALTDWAAQTLGVVTVPVYPTLPAEQAQYIARDCGAKVAICQDAAQATKFLEVERYVWEEGGGYSLVSSLGAAAGLTREHWEAEIDSTALSDLATIIYTSGTTGNPKGVMLRHESFVFLNENIYSSLPVDETDTFLSWLPLSHVFERYAGHILPVSVGATIAYAGSVASLAGDMVTVKPTIVLCVPRFLDSVRGRIVDGVRKQGGLKSKLFEMALAQGAAKRAGGFAPLYGILDRLVGTKIRERTGGKIKFFVSGGAALPPAITEFYLSFGLNVLQGYGLTETCAASNVNHPDDNDPETVGPPIQGVELKIASDGEILLRGPSVMAGYFNLPDDTAAAIGGDGWFHTGDIGEMKGDKLKITDRKKDILVLGNGKNVAPQPVENRLKESEFIGEVVLLGDGQDSCSALIVPNFDRVKVWLEGQGVSEKDPLKMIELDSVRGLINQEVKKANQKLADFERVKRHTLIGKAFSVEDGELTPSLKVKRKVVKEKYAEEIASMVRGRD